MIQKQTLCVIGCIILANVGATKKFNSMAKIFKGNSAEIQKYPYLVLLEMSNNTRCGGSLVTTSCVLTAAHCVYDEPLDMIKVIGGQTNYKVTSKSKFQMAEGAALSDMFYHDTSDMDVAIVKLKQPLVGRDISTVELDFNKIPEKSYLSIAGWGSKSGKSQRSQNLKEAVVVTMADNECKIKTEDYYTKNMFCAKGFRGEDACQGDSGGPALLFRKQVGIVSWGYDCDDKKDPGVYTQLSSPDIKEFIETAMKRFC